MVSSKRLEVKSVKPYENIGIVACDRIDEAHWISAPGVDGRSDVVMEFGLEYPLSGENSFSVEVKI